MNQNLKALGTQLLVYSVLVAAITVVGLMVAAGPTGVDSAVMNTVAATRHAGLTSVVSLLTEMFSPALVPVWALCVAGYLLARERRVYRAAVVVSSVVGAAAVAEVIKLVVARPRPPAADQVGAYEATLSYPSGHVTGTGALLVSAAVVATAAHRAARVGAVVAALMVTVFVAWTRLYLGVHWLSDVTAGLLIGAASAALVASLIPAVITLVVDRAGHRIPSRASSWLAPTSTRTARHAAGAHQ